MPETEQPELVTAQLERIVTSPPLESSPSLCRFLRFVVNETMAGRSGSLKEYSLGVAVFDRGEEFDPRMDPIVRVQARNLRVKLAQYYAGAGAADNVIIDLPKRTYVPLFRNREAEPEPPAPEAVSEPVSEPVLSLAVAEAPLPEIAEPAPSAPSFRASAPKPARLKTALAVTAGVLLVVAATSAFWEAKTHGAFGRETHQPDPVAQDLYIRGRYSMDRQTERALHEGIECFSQAIARDAKFAAAYAGLADAYNVLAQYGYIAPREGMEEARRAAARAIEIDPSLAEGHVSLAAVMEAYDWNWSGAEREYHRALELNPWLASAHLWYGMFLRDQGRLQEALPELRRAAQLEPFSILTSINLAHAYVIAGNYDAAVEEAAHAARLAPDIVTADVILSNAYTAQQHPSEAEAALDHALAYAPNNPHAMSVLACAFARHGRKEESLRLSHQLEELSKQRYVSPFDLATVSLVLGDEKHAIDLLEEAYRQRSSGLIFLRDAKFASVYRSPGFHSLIEKMHFAG